nr:hypothetical protein [Tanacetum cinerariifolium]
PLFDEGIISIKIDPHHFNVESDLIKSLLNQDSSIISSSKIDSLLDGFAEEFNSENSDAIIESFSPSPIPVEDNDPFMEEIDLFLAFDGSIPPGIDSDYSDSEEDNLFPERLLHDDPIPLPDILDFSIDTPIYYDDDDEEESSTPLRDIIIFKLPPCITITPILSTKETKDSLIMKDEHLDTIPKKESDKFIKSGVENLVPNPSESEDLSNIGSECDVTVCDDFITFSNSLFDADEKFSSSDDESFSDEDFPKEIYSNPLFDEGIISIKIDPHHFNVESDLIKSLLNQDSSIISSSKIDSLLDGFAGFKNNNISQGSRTFLFIVIIVVNRSLPAL